MVGSSGKLATDIFDVTNNDFDVESDVLVNWIKIKLCIKT